MNRKRESGEDIGSCRRKVRTEREDASHDQHRQEVGSKQISSSLFQLYAPTPPDPVRMDIFFFHGLKLRPDSDIPLYVSTWRSRDASQVWPGAWLPEKYPAARIIAVSYDGSIRTTDTEGRMDMFLIGENLMEEILLTRDHEGYGRDCPIILVGHSFGGLVIKQLCCFAHRKKETAPNSDSIITFLDSIKGIFFYATPHSGMEEFWKGCTELSGGVERNADLLKFVHPLSTEAGRLHEAFCEMKQNNRYRWTIYGIGETHLTLGLGRETPLVPEASARFGKFTTAACDHFSICKPTDSNCVTYVRLLDLIHQVHGERQVENQENEKFRKAMVGVDSVLMLINTYLQEYRFLGFFGMGGVGKTTIAKRVFHDVHDKFEYACFMEDFKQKYGDKDELRKMIWGKMLHRLRNGIVEKARDYSDDVWENIVGKKLLLILDDIDTDDHVKVLESIAEKNAMEDSRFIATSRDKQRLDGVSVHAHGKRWTYEIPVLKHEDARNLFVRHAFPGMERSPERLKDKVEEVVEACGGLPLTLEVMGKCLRTRKSEKLWDETLTALKDAESIPGADDERLWGKLKVSYDSLEDNSKEMLLDIACAFSQKNCRFSYEQVKSAWSSMYKNPKISLTTLVERSLVKIVKSDPRETCEWCKDWSPVFDIDDDRRTVRKFANRKLQMHEQIKSMGQKIARDKGKMNVHGYHDFKSGCGFCTLQRSLPELTTCRYLDINFGRENCGQCDKNGGLSLPTGLVILLVSVDWHNCHLFARTVPVWERLAVLEIKICGRDEVCLSPQFRTLPVALSERLQTLRHLDVSDDSDDSNRSPLFVYEKIQNLQHLSYRCFSSADLENDTLTYPDMHTSLSCPSNRQNFGSLTGLEVLHLEAIDFLPETIGNLGKLKRLKLVRCTLEKLPTAIGGFRRLTHLYIEDCDNLKQLPENLGGSRRLPHTSSSDAVYGDLSNLKHLVVRACPQLKDLPNTFGNLSALQHLCISYCTELSELPETFGNLSALQHLEIESCRGLTLLPDTFGNLSALHHLAISVCDKLTVLPETFGNLSALQHLSMSCCFGLTVLPETFGNLSALQDLAISNCTKLSKLPETFGNLSALQHLAIQGSRRLIVFPETFGKLSALQDLSISGCRHLTVLPATFGNLSALQDLFVAFCTELTVLPETFGNLSALQNLGILKCTELNVLPETFGNLSALQVLWCTELNVLPETFGKLSALQGLRITYCRGLTVLPETFGNLSALQQLDIAHCRELTVLPETFGNLSALQQLCMSDCEKLTVLPDTFGNLRALQHLKIQGCRGLTVLPETFGKLLELRSLELAELALDELPTTFGQLIGLERLALIHCCPNVISLFAHKFHELINLRHLELCRCYSAENDFPVNWGRTFPLVEELREKCRNLLVFCDRANSKCHKEERRGHEIDSVWDEDSDIDDYSIHSYDSDGDDGISESEDSES